MDVYQINNRSFIDDYEHLDSSIEYILENQLYPSDKTESYKKLEDEFNCCISKSCNCIESAKCCIDVLNCFHGSNYIMAKDHNELILNKNRLSTDLIYECSSLCSCPSNCFNRLLQFGPRLSLKIINVSKGFEQFGLITETDVVKGSFICEYIGEILTKDEAIKRDTHNKHFKKMNYIICLNEIAYYSNHKIQTFIDPSRKGNIGRYLNHSCDPNCEIMSVRVDSIIPRIGIFASRDIKSNEELCFNYGGDLCNQPVSGISELHKSDRLKCYCKAFNCKNVLPNNKF